MMLLSMSLDICRKPDKNHVFNYINTSVNVFHTVPQLLKLLCWPEPYVLGVSPKSPRGRGPTKHRRISPRHQLEV